MVSPDNVEAIAAILPEEAENCKKRTVLISGVEMRKAEVPTELVTPDMEENPESYYIVVDGSKGGIIPRNP